MKRSLALMYVLAVLVLALAGCPAADNPASTVNYNAVTTTDVNTAGSAFGRAMSTSTQTLGANMQSATITYGTNTMTINFTSSDGKIHVVETLNGSPSTPSHLHMVMTFTNLYDSASGYTINGTITMDENITYSSGTTISQMSMTYAADLNFSGTGPIQKLTMNFSGTQIYTSGVPSGSPTYSGTITCNGHDFSPSDLGPGF